MRCWTGRRRRSWSRTWRSGAALSHFQPEGVLVADGPLRAERRRFNEAVLDTRQPVHQLADAIVAKVREEAQRVADPADGAGALSWDDFAVGWWRMVRRVVLGDAAAGDDALTDELGRLRAHANWAYLRPRRTALRHRFLEHLQGHVESGSLAALVAATPASAGTAAVGQVPQWLFAFDAAGIASPPSSTATTRRFPSPTASPRTAGLMAVDRPVRRSCRSAPGSAPGATSSSWWPARCWRRSSRGTGTGWTHPAASTRAAPCPGPSTPSVCGSWPSATAVVTTAERAVPDDSAPACSEPLRPGDLRLRQAEARVLPVDDDHALHGEAVEAYRDADVVGVDAFRTHGHQASRRSMWRSLTSSDRT
jgi:hypothetical protein